MQTNILSAVARLSDRHLLDEVKRLAARERDVTAELIAHLAEIEERGLHHAEGFGSMFLYCRQVLLLSEHAAYGRIEAARAARKFPVIVEMLAEGSLNLTAVGLLGRHLTRDNYRTVLAEAKGRSKSEVEEIVARLHPQPDVPSTIRKLPEAKPVVASGALIPAAAATPAPSALPAPSVLPLPPAPSRVVTPLAPDRYKVQFTVSKDTCEKLRLAQDLLRHVIPDADPGVIFDRALTVLLDDLARRKYGVDVVDRACAAAERGEEIRDHEEVSAAVPRPPRLLLAPLGPVGVLELAPVLLQGLPGVLGAAALEVYSQIFSITSSSPCSDSRLASSLFRSGR